MMKNSSELIQLLDLEKITDLIYQGKSISIGSPHVFGGQALSQALNAAYRTIQNKRIAHSLHAYFLEAGNLEIPIQYKVDIIRNGGSFSTRRVTATQESKTIFIMAASFHKKETGYEHQIQLDKKIKQPEELLSWTELHNQFGDIMPKKTKAFLEIERPIDFKPTKIPNPLEKQNLPPYTDVWFKLKGELPRLDLTTKQQLLTYISDYNILNPTLNPHASKANYGNVQMASLDHSMWFFRDFDFDDWMLYTIESPNTIAARGFARGNIYNRKGELIASVAQEGLLRPITK